MFDQRRMSAPLPHQQKNIGLMNVPLNLDMRRQSDPSAGVPTISISPTEHLMGSLNNVPAHVTSPINSKFNNCAHVTSPINSTLTMARVVII